MSDSKTSLEVDVLSWNSWLDFERLKSLDSHLSKVFHALATESLIAALIATQPDLAPQILGDLNVVGIKSIVLRIHTKNNIQTAFFIDMNSKIDDEIGEVSRIGTVHQAPYLIPTQKGQLAAYRIDPADQKKLNLHEKSPGKLRKYLSWMLDSEVQLIESGVFDADPLFTRTIYSEAGLISDIPFQLLKATAHLTDEGLLRPRDRRTTENH